VDSITKPDAAASEAVLMAGIGHYKVISVDYCMPPADYFPVALDDVGQACIVAQSKPAM
jgi:acetyl esterase/lipase